MLHILVSLICLANCFAADNDLDLPKERLTPVINKSSQQRTNVNYISLLCSRTKQLDIRDASDKSISVAAFAKARKGFDIIGVVRLISPNQKHRVKFSWLEAETDYSHLFSFNKLTPASWYDGDFGYFYVKKKGSKEKDGIDRDLVVNKSGNINLTYEDIDWISSKLRHFRIFTDNPDAEKTRFIATSCDHFFQVGPISFRNTGRDKIHKTWRVIQNQAIANKEIAPTLILANGDNRGYMDTVKQLPFTQITSLKWMRKRYEAANTPGQIRVDSTFETKSMEDDHGVYDNHSRLFDLFNLENTPREFSAKAKQIYNAYKEIWIRQHPKGPKINPPALPKFKEEDNFDTFKDQIYDILEEMSPMYGQSFDRGPASFFQFDARFDRVIDLNGNQVGICNKKQWEDFENWLSEKSDYVKFMITQVPLFIQKNDDTWWAFKEDIKRLINICRKLDVHHLYVISGDSHSSGIGRFEVLEKVLKSKKKDYVLKHKGEKFRRTGLRITEMMFSSKHQLSMAHDYQENFFNGIDLRGVGNNGSDYLVIADQSIENFRKGIFPTNNFGDISVNVSSGRKIVSASIRRPSGRFLQSITMEDGVIVPDANNISPQPIPFKDKFALSFRKIFEKPSQQDATDLVVQALSRKIEMKSNEATQANLTD